MFLKLQNKFPSQSCLWVLEQWAVVAASPSQKVSQGSKRLSSYSEDLKMFTASMLDGQHKLDAMEKTTTS